LPFFRRPNVDESASGAKSGLWDAATLASDVASKQASAEAAHFP
jgi:hypothetical protein